MFTTLQPIIFIIKTYRRSNMKKHLIALSVLMTLSISITFGQSEQKNSLKANPLGLIVGIGKINYERKITDASSAQLGISYFKFSNDGSSISGLSLIPEFRFYVSKKAIDGFYLAPFFRYRNLTVKDEDDGFKASLNNYGGGAKAGFNWLLGKEQNFVIDLAFGAKYQDFSISVKEGTEDDLDNENLFHGFSPELHFALGFAF